MKTEIWTTLDSDLTEENVLLHARALENVNGMKSEFACRIREDSRRAIRSQLIFEQLRDAARKDEEDAGPETDSWAQVDVMFRAPWYL